MDSTDAVVGDRIDGIDGIPTCSSAEEFVSFLQRMHEQLAGGATTSSEGGTDTHRYDLSLRERATQLQRMVEPGDSVFHVLAHQLNIDSIDGTSVTADSIRSATCGATQPPLLTDHSVLVAAAEQFRVGIVVVTCLNCTAILYRPATTIGNRMLWVGLSGSYRYHSLVPNAPVVAKRGPVDADVLNSISNDSLRNAAARIRREMGFESFQLITRLVRKKLALPQRESGTPWSERLGKSPTLASSPGYYRLLNALWLVKKAGSSNLTGGGAAFKLFTRCVESLGHESRSKVRGMKETLTVALFDLVLLL